MNIPMFWITLDLVELYYSGPHLRHQARDNRPRQVLGEIEHAYAIEDHGPSPLTTLSKTISACRF